MKDNRAQVDDRREGFICTELPFMAATGLTVALERRHVPDRRVNSANSDLLDKEEKD